MIEEEHMVQDISKSIEACAAHYGSDADAMRASSVDEVNEAMAHCMGNKGPHLIEVIV